MGTSVADHLEQERARLAGLKARHQKAANDKEHKQALRWLAEHRNEYAGKWIALRGAELLVVGNTASEVFKCVRGQRPPAMVVKVELEEFPFGGW